MAHPGHLRRRRFLISPSSSRSVRVFLKADDITIAHCEHVGKVTAVLTAGGFDAPAIVAQGDNFVTLRYELARLKFQRLLVCFHPLEEFGYSRSTCSLPRKWHAFNLRQLPGDIIGKQIEQSLNIAGLEVVVSLLNYCDVLFSHRSFFLPVSFGEPTSGRRFGGIMAAEALIDSRATATTRLLPQAVPYLSVFQKPSH